MLVLARFIAPAGITVFEINKRPVNIAYSLIGRHSVALMPLISHAKGKGDKDAIIDFINQQFRFYLYAALFAVFMFCFNYENLIAAWTGREHFAGNTIMLLLVANFFCSLICYFMATVGYALGDIKSNSVYNIIRGIVYGILIFFGAKTYGIIGTLVVSLVITTLSDFFFYIYRLHKIGYLPPFLLKIFVMRSLIIVTLSMLVGWQFRILIDHLVPATMYFNKLLVNAALFTCFFIILILIIDREFRKLLIKFTNRYLLSRFYKEKNVDGLISKKEE
jgi:O-antigen/teichoic acid export membrane protein